MSLYKISQQYQDCLTQLEDVDLELSPEDIEAALDPIKDSFQQKALNLRGFMQSVDDQIDIIKQEEKRLRERKRVLVNKQKGFKDYLLKNMQETGISKIKSDLFDIRLAKCPPKVEIISEGDIPSILLKIETTPDLTAIKSYLEKNGNQPWAKVVQGETVRVK